MNVVETLLSRTIEVPLISAPALMRMGSTRSLSAKIVETVWMPSQASAPAWGSEYQVEADRRRPVFGQGHASGRAFKKALKPGRKRELVDKVRSEMEGPDQAGLFDPSDRSSALCLQFEARRPGRSQAPDQGHLRDASYVLLQRDSRAINVKRVYRLYKELGLQLRNKTPKRRVKAKLREDRTDACQINETWAMDFVHDQLATGRKIRVLTIVDTFSRFSPAVNPRFSYRGEDVVLTLKRVCKTTGYPKTIRVDQGSEFISRDLDIWAYQKGIVLNFSRPGKPTDNSFIESFNGKFRSECLNTHWFLSLDDARQKMEDWRRHYNEVRRRYRH